MKRSNNNLKILFLNVQTLSAEKLEFLIELLIDYDIIFLSEINNKQQFLTQIDNQICKYHFDTETTRLAMITRNSVNFEYIGKGLVLEQERVQTDQIVVQSNFYRFKLVDNRVFEVENFYVTPDANTETLKSVSRFLNARGWTRRMYIAGGDFNINWKNVNKRNMLKLTALEQNVKNYTRIRNYTTLNGNTRTSKTIIDLILTNQTVKPKIVETEILDTSNLSFFDHNGVVLCLDFPKGKPYRDIKVAHDPFRRPEIDTKTYELIKLEIDLIEHEYSYDNFMLKTKQILDKHIPMNGKRGAYTKRLYDFPFPSEIRNQIRKKHLLQKKVKSHPSPENKLEYTKHRNNITKIIRKFKKDHITRKLLNQNSANAINKTIEFLQKSNSTSYKETPLTIIDGSFGTDLVNKLGKFLKARAEDLVQTEDIINSPDLTDIFDDSEIPTDKLVLKNFPAIVDIYKVVPKNKITKTASMDGISSHTLVEIWPIIQEPMNKILTSSLKFPSIDQGYYQRVISKESTKQPKIFKDMRPLGILNIIPKYAMSKFVWTKIRKHIEPILKKRKIMTYQGCKMPIINTLDGAIIETYLGFFVIIQKFDFSNAFGTLFLDRLLTVASQLNMCDEILEFVRDFIINQAYCSTLLFDGGHGVFLSDVMDMEKGAAQGQCGTDVAFTLLQLGLSPALDIGRNYYMDDINDLIKRCKTALDAIFAAKNNDNRLTEQAVRVGFAKNTLKTTYIPINFDKQIVIDNGIDAEYVLTETGILGFNFEVKNSKICTDPAARDIVCSIKQHLGTIHSTRTYVSNHFDRLKIARKLVYYHLGFISLVYAYGVKTSNNPGFQTIQVAVNDIIRATGLRRNTPQHILDKCFGTSLTDFARDSVIIDGKKEMQMRDWTTTEIYDRLFKIRTTRIELKVKGTFMRFFADEWNKFDPESRKSMAGFTIDQLKVFLKNRRRLQYDDSIYDQYFWIDLRE